MEFVEMAVRIVNPSQAESVSTAGDHRIRRPMPSSTELSRRDRLLFPAQDEARDVGISRSDVVKRSSKLRADLSVLQIGAEAG